MLTLNSFKILKIFDNVQHTIKNPTPVHRFKILKIFDNVQQKSTQQNYKNGFKILKIFDNVQRFWSNTTISLVLRY